MVTRTSATHPLEIATLPCGGGRLGITFCPGKHQNDAYSGTWARDLSTDLDAIAAWGASTVVTLVEQHELVSLGVPKLGEEISRRGIAWYHLPIPDVTAPDAKFEQAWATAGPELRAAMVAGRSVLVHCKGGLGRAGTIAARLLIEAEGFTPSDAIAAIRRTRGAGAIETAEQERYLMRLAKIRAENRDQDLIRDRARGALLGLAIGDAVGTTFEFRPRDTYEPLTDMVGGGPFRLPVGVWTDDTSMALALADSLIACGKLDPADLMARFCSWWRDGAYSPTGTCFDIGNTTAAALAKFERTGNPMAGSDHPNSAGNGSLMRLAPIAIWGVAAGEQAMREAARLQSATTHAATICLDACEIFAVMLRDIVLGASLSDALEHAQKIASDIQIGELLVTDWATRSRDQVRSSGYVLHSFEAALWCLTHTADYREAVLLAANLGNDADTTAAITGQLAGALFGLQSLPETWLSRVAWSEKLKSSADRLLLTLPPKQRHMPDSSR